ncbi:hypothetical protein J2Z50_005142 [Ensifer mexicanus]|nr:hypothetical protein [Sinorhizobium mexicanum]
MAQHGGTPLCPAGHLPHKGGDQGCTDGTTATSRSEAGTVDDRKRGARCLPISPLVGEMPGRAEGGTNTRSPDFGQRNLEARTG